MGNGAVRFGDSSHVKVLGFPAQVNMELAAPTAWKSFFPLLTILPCGNHIYPSGPNLYVTSSMKLSLIS